MASPPAPSPPAAPAAPSRNFPSSFDSDPEFFEEGRWGKIFRRLREEPLIPLGLGATIYALYQAAMSIQVGDHQRTNRMFRARVYAQGFTLVAMVGGSYYWRDDRMKRKELEKAMTEKKQMEKRERWLQELEERDREDRNWRTRFEEVAARAKEAEEASKAASRSLPGFSKSSIGGSRQGAGDKSKVASPAAEGSEKKTTGEALKQASEAVKAADKKGGSTQREIEKEEKMGEEDDDFGIAKVKKSFRKVFQNKSVLEEVERTGWGRGMWLLRESCRKR